MNETERQLAVKSRMETLYFFTYGGRFRSGYGADFWPTQCCYDLSTGRVPDRIAWDYWRNLFYSYARRPEDLIVPLYPPEAKGFEIYNALNESDDYFPRYITAVGEWVEHQENRGPTERFATLKELEWACQHSHFTFSK